MSLKTRIDGRSENNNTIYLKDRQGNIVGQIVTLDRQSINLEVITHKDYYIEKKNGWSSINYKGA